MVDKQKLVRAMNYLIAAPHYAKLINEMTRTIERWDFHPMVYGGKLEMLNALLDVGLENREAFERLLALIEAKRKLTPRTKRADYQRKLMRARRARLAKAFELAEMTAGKLDADARKEREAALLTSWQASRDQYVTESGATTWDDRNKSTREFWEIVDRQLDANLQLARRKP